MIELALSPRYGLGPNGGTPTVKVRSKPNRNRLPKAVAAMVHRIVTRFRPERVILFGSHARGTATADSDLDLLVVMQVSGSKREKALEIRLVLQEFRISKDIVVTTPADFAWRKEIPGTVERPAELEGKVLYARP